MVRGSAWSQLAGPAGQERGTETAAAADERTYCTDVNCSEIGLLILIHAPS